MLCGKCILKITNENLTFGILRQILCYEYPKFGVIYKAGRDPYTSNGHEICILSV